MYRLSVLSLCVAGLVSLEGCKKEKETAPKTSLLATRWLLVQVEETPIGVSSSSSSYRSYIEFSNRNTTAGLGPCNSFSGTFSQGSTAGQLSISQQASARAACAATNLEDKYLNALPRTVRFEISDKELRLYDATNSLRPLLIFEDSTK
ncbi:META domain-containing protein [Hymenobacter sp.]|jgi:heat shock protein HslJ|uniref:META domain-containing protein n=1 Tax=Hymenobacter sp. TaxID=1898978 RepID=UPI002ED92DDA